MENHNSLPDGVLINGNAEEEEEEEEEEVGSFLFMNSTCNWDNSSMDQNDPFESALSSMVSSPVTSSYGGGGGGGENIVVKELIGRLGGICNSDENGISSHSYNNTTPLNSPPNLNLSSIRDHQNQIRGNFPFSGSHSSFVSADPGFAPERAPMYYSCFTNNMNNNNLSGSGLIGQIGMNDAEFGHRLVHKLDSSVSVVSSNHSINIPGSQMHIQDRKFSKFSPPEYSAFGDSSMDISSLTEQITRNENVMIGSNEDNPRKRKSVPKDKTKEPTSLNSSKDANIASENTVTNAKRSKSKEDNGLDKDGTKVKEESNNGSDKTAAGNGKDNINAKQPEPPKDYIHVRARRGQATDAHSLAERVRREKISEKMTFLQDLVPGCNKVTGKAVMLDEIINYVQSLQHQVEFLSMKLATINPISDFNAEAHFSKDVIQTQVPLHHMHNMYPSDPYPLYPPQGPNVQSTMPNGIEVVYSMNHLNAAANGQDTSIIQLPPSNNFSELPSQVTTTYWGDDLHSVVQMGLGQNETQNSMVSEQGSSQQHK